MNLPSSLIASSILLLAGSFAVAQTTTNSAAPAEPPVARFGPGPAPSATVPQPAASAPATAASAATPAK